jgi:hypothetical protein
VILQSGRVLHVNIGRGYNNAVGAERTLKQLLTHTGDANIRFDDLCALLEKLGFEVRIRGSHHLFRMSSIEERISICSETATKRSRTKYGR